MLFICFSEGPFQSDALLVPENCLFDHIHNQTKCWQFGRWNVTAQQSCLERDLSLRSFAMLLPCGISLFSGVEFVCCPKHFKGMPCTDLLQDWMKCMCIKWLQLLIWIRKIDIRHHGYNYSKVSHVQIYSRGRFLQDRMKCMCIKWLQLLIWIIKIDIRHQGYNYSKVSHVLISSRTGWNACALNDYNY